mgnify:CR=1 FL=1
MRIVRLRGVPVPQRGARRRVRSEAGAASWDLPAPAGPYDRRMGYADLRKERRCCHAQGFDVVALVARSNEALARIAQPGTVPRPTARSRRRGPAHHAAARARRCSAPTQPVARVHDASTTSRRRAGRSRSCSSRTASCSTPPRRAAIPPSEWDRSGCARSGPRPDSGRPGRQHAAPRRSRSSATRPRASPSPPREKLRQMLSASLRAYRDGD